MFLKATALPRPRSPQEAAPTTITFEGLQRLVEQRDQLARELDLRDVEIDNVVLRSICGPKDDSQDVEQYDGTLGVTRAFVDRYEPPVGQFQWLDLTGRFTGAGDSPGTVSGERWCTGALIEADGDDLFLTAGHCFAPSAKGWILPQQNGMPLSPYAIAKLMRVNFNYQLNGTTSTPRPGDPFPVLELLEYGYPCVDYAIVKLGPNGAGTKPSSLYRTLSVAKKDLTTPGAMLCVIQHPNRELKKIEAGPLRTNSSGIIRYQDLDVQNGASGSPVLSDNGEIVGVHVRGGCRSIGVNRGIAIGAIRGASQLIK